MTLTTRILTATTLALGIGLAATPVQAQLACDLNGAPQIPPPGNDTFVCGNTVLDLTGVDNLTLVGRDVSYSGDQITVVGSNAIVSAGGAFFLFGGYSPPAEAGSTAVGAYAFIAGTGDVAIGDQAIVGDVMTSPGVGINAIVVNGTAVGSHSLVNADAGTAVGSQAAATGVGASALGTGASASGEGSVAVGQFSSASDFDSVAIGFGSGASGASSVAVGDVAQATAANSVAVGAGSIANQANTVSVGSAGNERRVVNVAAGVNATDAVNVSQLSGVTTNVTNLQTQITSVQTVNTTQATQISALQAADTAFDSRIDALEGLALDFAGDLDRVDDRASAGTATAIALSGAMFLPGKTFNLTGNVGAYRGAVAGALQVGAMVSQSVALNAGIAHGFNKHGKTGLRAGFTVGW